MYIHHERCHPHMAITPPLLKPRPLLLWCIIKCHLLLCYISDLHLVHELRGVETSILSLNHTSDLSEIRSTRNNSDTATTTCFFMNTSIRSYTIKVHKKGVPDYFRKRSISTHT